MRYGVVSLIGWSYPTSDVHARQMQASLLWPLEGWRRLKKLACAPSIPAIFSGSRDQGLLASAPCGCPRERKGKLFVDFQLGLGHAASPRHSSSPKAQPRPVSYYKSMRRRISIPRSTSISPTSAHCLRFWNLVIQVVDFKLDYSLLLVRSHALYPTLS